MAIDRVKKSAGESRILILTLVFAPDGVSTATLVSELAGELRSLGHPLQVITTTPHYNKEPEALAAQPMAKRWGGWLWQSKYLGIPVYHAQVRAKGKRVIGRLVDYLRFHAIGTAAGLLLVEPYDFVLAVSPPLTIGLSARLLASVRRVPYIYNVQEIYPDIAVRLGVLKNRAAIWMIERMERFIYERARVVVVISESFQKRLAAKGVPAEKLCVIPNFVDVDFVQPGDRANSFSVEHNLEKYFVVLYAGNVGLTQDLETILCAADKLRKLEDILILIVGDGARREWLAERLERSGVENVRLLPYQPRSVVPQIYASSDACLVPLRPGTGYGTFPSKIYTIMAAGRPVIASAEPDTELALVVARARCGITVPPGEPNALAVAIETLYRQRERSKQMGLQGRDFVVQYHSPQSVALQYHELVNAVTLSHKAG